MTHLDPFTVKAGTLVSIRSGAGPGSGEGPVLDQVVVRLADGQECSITVAAGGPVLVEGAACALLLRAGQPVTLRDLASGGSVWVNDGPETDAPKGVRTGKLAMGFILIALIGMFFPGAERLGLIIAVIGVVVVPLNHLRTGRLAARAQEREDQRQQYIDRELGQIAPGTDVPPVED
ncbi:MAG: hypothetical protein ACK5IB_05100 [Qingshengfaniella sp.]